MKLYLPLPFLSVQSNVELRKQKDFDEFEIYIILMIYSCQELNEIDKDTILSNAIKKFMNLDDKYYEFVETIIKRLIKNQVVIIKNQELSKETMIGNIELNKTIKTNIDNNIFKGFSTESKKETYFAYKNLIPIENWEIVREKLIKDLNKNENLICRFDVDESFVNKNSEIINAVENFSTNKNKNFTVSKIDLLEKKLVYINMDLNFEFDRNELFFKDDYSKNIFFSAYESIGKLNYFYDVLSNQLRLKNDKFANYKFKQYNSNDDEFISNSDKLIEINNNYEKLNSLFENCFNYVVNNDNLYFLSKIEKDVFIKVNNDKIRLSADFIILNKINSDDIKSITKSILENLNWDELNENLNIIPNTLKRLLIEVSFYLLSKYSEFNNKKYNYKIISDFLSNFNFQKDNHLLDKVLFNKDMIGNHINSFTRSIFENDASKNKSYINEFLNVSISEFPELEKYLVEIYKFDYDIKTKYFKDSINESSITQLKDFINNINWSEIESDKDINKLEKVKIDFGLMKNKIKYVQPKFIKDFEQKINKIDSKFEYIFERKKDELKGLSTRITNTIENMIKKVFAKNNKEWKIFNSIQKMLEEKIITSSESDQLLKYSNFRNKLVHENDKDSSNEKITKDNINDLFIEANEILKKTNEIVEQILNRHKG